MTALGEKMFYRMGDAAEITGLEPHVLRAWENEFPQLKPRKNRSGHRVFTRENIELILHIKRLVQDEGYTIAGARNRLQEDAGSDQKGPNPLEAKQRMLDDVREVRQLLENVLKMLDPDEAS